MSTAKERKITPLPADTNAALREVMNTMNRISDLYEEETKALIDIDSKRFLELQEKKLEQSASYQAHLSEMINRKDELRFADPSLRTKLKQMQTSFHALAARNLEALERMQRCTDRLAQTIRNAAVRTAQSQRNFSYGNTGTLNNATRNKVISTGLSETA